MQSQRQCLYSTSDSKGSNTQITHTKRPNCPTREEYAFISFATVSGARGGGGYTAQLWPKLEQPTNAPPPSPLRRLSAAASVLLDLVKPCLWLPRASHAPVRGRRGGWRIPLPLVFLPPGSDYSPLPADVCKINIGVRCRAVTVSGKRHEQLAVRTGVSEHSIDEENCMKCYSWRIKR